MSDPKAPKGEHKEAKADEAPKAGGSSKAILAVVAVNFLVTAGLGAFLVLRPAPQPVVAAAPAPKAAKESEHAAKEEKSEGGGEHGEKKEGGEGGEGGEHGEKKEGEGGGKDDSPPGSTARLDDIIVHLRNPEVDRYARLTLDVEMASPSELPQLNQRTAQIRDAVITTLSEETYESLRGSEGLQRMKETVRARIDDIVPGNVRAVYVSGFIVQ